MYSTTFLRDSFEPMNNDPSQYITVHRNEPSNFKIRKNYDCIPSKYTIDVFPKYTYIHHQASPSITVT
jgi:hypothetical protein